MNEVYGLLNWQWWWSAGWFLVSTLISCWLPGWAILRRFKLKFHSAVVTAWLSLIIGLVVWAAQGYVLGYLGLRLASYAYIGWWLWYGVERLRLVEQFWETVWHEVRQAKWWLLATVALGLIIQLLPVFGSGLKYADGVRFYRVNAYDGMMHLAYIQEIAQNFPPEEPGAAGIPLMNYHYWSDLVMAEYARVWRLPISHLYFQFFPFFISITTAVATYMVVRLWGGLRSTGWWALFFLYGGGDAAYLLMWILHRQWGWHIAAIDNGSTQFLNVPHTFAKLLFITALYPLTQWWRTKQWRWAALSVLLLAPLVGFKVYYGMFAAVGLSLAVTYLCLHRWWKTHRSFISRTWAAITGERIAITAVLMFAVISALIFFPVNRHAGGLFYSPLEWPKLFLGHDNLDFRLWWLRRQVYEAAASWKGLLATDGLAIVIALVCVHGTRLLGFLPHRDLLKKWGWPLSLFLIPSTWLFTWLGLFTLQESGLFNVFNFFVVTTIPLALMSAWWLDSWWRTGKIWWRAVVLLIAILTIPRVAYFSYFYIETYDHRIVERLVSNQELAAFEFLQKQGSCILQTHPAHSWNKNAPYLSFFTGFPSYASGIGMMETHNVPIADRKATLAEVFAAQNKAAFLDLAQKTDPPIHAIYLTNAPEERLNFPAEELGPVAFKNDVVTVIYLNCR